MPHTNPEPGGVDFTVVCYIVHSSEVLLAHHKKLNIWVPIGGHIDPGEDSETALLREIKEECGLNVQIYGQRPDFVQDGVVPLPRPRYMDIHEINDPSAPGHRHCAMVFFGSTEVRNEVLQEDEHFELHWFSDDTLAHVQYGVCDRFKIPTNVCWYGREAIKEVF